MQVLVPQGFMVSADPAQPGLVICTGHGPLTLGDRKGPAHAPKQASGGLCAFAVHGGAGDPPALARIASPAFAFAVIPLRRRAAPAPGVGLAASPPPSQAPPSILI